MNIASIIKNRRADLGLTQVLLSKITGISLPTIQNIEAGKANPSIETLSKLFDALDIEWSLNNKGIDWDLLASCGLPVLQKELPNKLPHIDLLVKELHKLHKDISLKQDDRLRDAVQAMLLAMSIHYPKIYDSYFKKDFPINLLRNLDGRLNKLKRLSLIRLSRFL